MPVLSGCLTRILKFFELELVPIALAGIVSTLSWLNALTELVVAVNDGTCLSPKPISSP